MIIKIINKLYLVIIQIYKQCLPVCVYVGKGEKERNGEKGIERKRESGEKTESDRVTKRKS